MSWYKTGTITVTNGSPTITGAGGTLWVDAGTLNAGDIMLLPDGNLYEIQSINSNTGITLASNYLGGSLSGQAYAIMPIGLLPSALAQQVKSVLTVANTALASAVRFDTAAQGLTSGQQQNARTNIAALGAADVGAGRLSKSVAGGADVALTATEAANQFIELTGALTANINVTVPAAARLFMIYNATSGAYTLTVKTAAGTGLPVPQGYRVVLECDGTNVVSPVGAVNTGSTSLVLLGTSAGTQAVVGGSNAGAVNYPRIAGGPTTVPPIIICEGADANIDLRVASKGSGIIGFWTAGVYSGGILSLGAQQFQINHLSGATNFITVTGSNGGSPKLSTNAGGLQIDAADVILFSAGGTENGRMTTNGGGYFKASNNGTYLSASGTFHELSSTVAGQICVFRNSNAAFGGETVDGIQVDFSASAPNGTGNHLLYCNDSGGLRAGIRSNGGLANYSANDVNLSDARLKSEIGPIPFSAWSLARTLGGLLEEGEYTDAPGRRVLMMRAQRLEQEGLERFVDRNVRQGLALLRGLHEQQIDQVFRAATGEVLAWADEEAKPAIASLGQRVARIEQQLNIT